MSSHDDLPTSEELTDTDQVEEVVGKGKGVTKPMPIRAPITIDRDLFDITYSGDDPPSTSHDPHQSFFLSQPASSSFTPLFDDNPQEFYPNAGVLSNASESAFDQWKGKGRAVEHPPTLPPLVFSPTEFGYGQLSSQSPVLTSSSPEPSSYGSNYGLSIACSTTNNEPRTRESGVPDTVPRPPTPSNIGHPVIKRMPLRSRSLSNLSIYSTRSLAARSMSRIKFRFSRPNTPSTLTRKLLFKRTADKSENSSPSIINIDQTAGDGADAGMNSFWRTNFKVDELDSAITQLSSFRLPDTDSEPSKAFFCPTSPLKHKGRSNSSPLPLSALDYIPVTTTDIFAPIPVVIRNYFDDLPRELRIQILAHLVASHEGEHLRAVREGRWSMAKASSSRNKWVGKDKGVRELVRLSRVSSPFQFLCVGAQTAYHARCPNHGKYLSLMVSYGLILSFAPSRVCPSRCFCVSLG
jgi:F-box and leucine-rich repeat protein 2/20